MFREGIVNTPLLPVYAERDILQIRTDELLYGMKVIITDTNEKDRYKIETDYQYTGLVPSKGIVCTESAVEAWNQGGKLTVSQSFCDVLAQPSVKSRVLLNLYRGAMLNDIGKAAEPGWHCVRLVDGTEGYVRQEQVRKPVCSKNFTEQELRAMLVETAYSYISTPYRWGGKSPIGIDCSGFTFMVYALNGIYIHRDSAWLPQYQVRKIADCEKKPGDLLYFPGHIAIYLSHGEYIHSTARDGAGVTINNLKKGCAGYREDLAGTYMFAGTVF